MTSLAFLFILLFPLTTAYTTVGFNPENVIRHEATAAETSSVSSTEAAVTQKEGFISVDGPNLKSRIEAAVKLGRTASSARFWTAYSFDVRSGVTVDADVVGRDGSGTIVGSTSVSFSTQTETRNLGIFLLHDSGSSDVTRVEVYNLERRREYSGYPVYWLGRANSQESLALLNEMVESGQGKLVSEHSVMAVALHDDPRVGSMLENMVRRSSAEKVQTSAVFWLGQIGGEQPFLAGLVGNEQENVEVRKQAAFSIGVGKEKGALSTLERLYGSVAPREVKRQIIFAASINENKDGAVDFLIKVASSDPDREMKKQALFWLGQKAGQRSMEALGSALDNDPDTEVQKQAVFAISQRSKDEAVPALIKIAKTHPKAEVRKQAMFWLGQTGDERALDFFKEVLLK